MLSTKIRIICGCAAMLLPAVAVAALDLSSDMLRSTGHAAAKRPVEVPHRFSDGTPAVADEVNDNFDALVASISELQVELGKLQAAHDQLESDVVELRSAQQERWTDWVEYAPTWENITFNMTTGMWRREGDSLHLRVAGQVQNVTGTILLDFSALPGHPPLTPDMDKLPGIGVRGSPWTRLGVATAFGGAVGEKLGIVIQHGHEAKLHVAAESWGNDHPFDWLSSPATELFIDATIPITGW